MIDKEAMAYEIREYLDVKGKTTGDRSMPKRSQSWNEGFANDLQDPDFAHAFILAALEEGLGLQEVLGKVIRTFGVKEYAAQAQMASSNVLRAINPCHNPTQATLNKLLKPMGLELTAAPIRKREAA